MVRREIEIDEETDRILQDLAAQHNSNLGEVLADLVRAHEGLEAFLEESEHHHALELKPLVDQAEKDFSEGRGIPWEKIKADHGL